MKIDFLGHSCFLINHKACRILIDPYAPSGKTRLAKQKADIVLITHEHPDHNNLDAVKDSEEAIIFRRPGEYDVQGIFIRGINSYHDDEEGSKRGLNTIYSIALENLNVCHLGDLGCIPEDDILEDIGPVDIVMIPIGGTYTIDAKQAVEVINLLSPKMVIPMHAKEDGFDYTAEFNTVDDLMAAMNGWKSQTVDRLELKSASEIQDKTVFILNRS